MAEKLLFIILAAILIFSGCVVDTDPVVITVDTTPKRTELAQQEAPTSEPSPTAAATPTPAPAPKEETMVYIEELPFDSDVETIYFSNWIWYSNPAPFNIGEQSYNKGIGMFVNSKDIKGSGEGSVEFGWDFDEEYYKLEFDLGSESHLQYGPKEKYGTFKVTLLADGAELWDSGFNDYRYMEIGKALDIPEGTKRLDVKLTQTKGEKGTLNVVMGSFRLYYYK